MRRLRAGVDRGLERLRAAGLLRTGGIQLITWVVLCVLTFGIFLLGAVIGGPQACAVDIAPEVPEDADRPWRRP